MQSNADPNSMGSPFHCTYALPGRKLSCTDFVASFIVGEAFAARAAERKQPSFPTDKCTGRSAFPAEPRAKLATKQRIHRSYILRAVGEGLSPVHTSQIFQAWGKILKGEQPSLSIEITRECPLKCPGCYAYDDAHLGGGQTLRDLNDRRGQSLVDGVLEVVDRLKPLHLSIVGGDPLVRYRELELLIPLLLARGIHVQIVTSAFRTMGPTWASLPRLHVVVSIDGLQPEHDVRRAPATYDRILKNIVGTEDHDSLHGHRSNDEATRILGRIPGILDATPGDQEGMVQPVHSSGWRSNAGNPEF